MLGRLYFDWEKENRIADFNWNYMLYTVLAFLIGKASIIDKLTPFGLAFWLPIFYGKGLTF